MSTPAATPHRIRRQRLQVHAPTRAAAFALRPQLLRAVEESLPQACERAFDALGLGEQVLHLPRLELHLQLDSADALAAQLPALLERALTDALHAAHAESTQSATPPTERSAQRAHATSQTPAAHALNALLYYLQHGQPAWPQAQQDAAALTATLRAAAEDWQASLAAVLASAPPAASSRLAFLLRLLPLLPSARREQLLTEAAVMTQALPDLSEAPAALPAVLPAILAFRAAQVPTSLPALHAEALALLLADPATPLATETLPALVTAHCPPLADALSRRLDARQAQLRHADEHADDMAQPRSTQPPAPTRKSLAAPATTTVPTLPRITPATPQPEEAPGLRVQLAGLVLLHPFLAALFAESGIARNADGMIAAAQLPRAAALLHHLAVGREEIFEFELGAIKPLLGLRPQDPLPVAPGLVDAAARAECDALLGAAIQHWPALRNTSVAGLRVSFLQRQGLLRDTSQGWQLQLERETFDMLLAHLPWSISIVRLPWMTRPIFTDWPTR